MLITDPLVEKHISLKQQVFVPANDNKGKSKIVSLFKKEWRHLEDSGLSPASVIIAVLGILLHYILGVYDLICDIMSLIN